MVKSWNFKHILPSTTIFPFLEVCNRMMKALNKSCLKLTLNLNLSISNFNNTLINVALYPKADICQRGDLT